MSKCFVAVLAAVLCVWAVQAEANFGPVVPHDFGTRVNGYELCIDSSMTMADLYADGWTWEGGHDGTQSASITAQGTLSLWSLAGTTDQHFLYEPAGVNYTTQGYQEILIRVKVTSTRDDARAGASVYSGERGINLLLRNQGNLKFRMLNDQKAWFGPDNPESQNPPQPAWEEGTLDEWYWLRIRREMGPSGTSGGMVYGNYWPADGLTPEPGMLDDPTTWKFEWNSGTSERDSGWAGMLCGNGAACEVDYILIKAPNLPEIRVVPEPATMVLLALGGLAMLRRRKCN